MSKQSSIPILITRPEPQAQRFADDLVRAIHSRFPALTPRIVFSPLMASAALPFVLPEGPFAHLVLTSETGAKMAGALRKAGHLLPETALCVGNRTAAEATAQGFSALSADGDARDLVTLILSRPDDGALLYLHGRDRAADLETALAGQRRVSSVAVYAQHAQHLTPETRGLLSEEGPILVPLLSPRSARLLVAELPEDSPAALWPVTISDNATQALPPDLARRTITATKPDAESVIEGVILAISRLESVASP